ncbi:RsmB/NOP family class I SAM-dependent RNA methyltransferase [Solirhodobacter olei]|uniref:RsmB/NOP family class I SAM-dependent RNA methyltransferase n=1 Tax=Solirhodobacter olei TaxID=2493082 RepID=UPI000FD9A280|nr:transcription antitermination factor NusB [Solirhodobacter olei]
MARADKTRQAAVALVEGVIDEGRMLSELVAGEGPLAALSPAERARAQRLALSVLRHVEPVDRILQEYLRKPPPGTALHVLRLAAVEMLVEGTPPHAAVSSAVEILRAGRRTAALAGLANAVLRKVAEAGDAFAKLPPQRLPRWLRQPLVHLWGREVVAAIEAVQAGVPPLDLTLRAGEDPAGWAARLEAEVLPTGSLRRAAGGQVSALEGYEAGAWWVQDAAAALPARMLAPQPGERVLDLCAAPGGKTLQLAAAGARVTALDVSPHRIERVRENLARTGLAADVVVADALDWETADPFDAILLDAPCSATGTIRRHPDLPFVKDGTELAGLVDLQSRLIDRAVAMLKPGGRLVFCTCSILPEEGEGQLAAALARHPGLGVEDTLSPGVPEGWRAPGGGIRTRPDHWAETGGIDGFFMAVLRLSA